MPAAVAEEILRQLESLDEATIESLPEGLKRRLHEATKKCSLALESPAETVSRILITEPTEAILVRIATDIRLFKALGKKVLTVSEISDTTGAQPRLLEYLLRGLHAYGAVEKIDQQKFVVAPRYALFQREDFENAFPGCQDFMQTIVGSWPAYLRTAQHQPSYDPNDTAVQYAFGAKGKSFWEVFQSDPTRAQLLSNLPVLMSAWADGFTQLPDLYSVQDRLQTGFDPQTAMFVDVGGNYGQKSLALKKAAPDLPGRFIVQDLPHIIERAPKEDPLYKDIEMTSHDMFTEQPIKGARCYYIRQVLHDWPDADAVKVLKRLRDAAKPGYSRILIQEIIVLETGITPWVASQDVNMLSMFALAERTEADWRSIIEQAGLRLSRVYTDNGPRCECVIEVEV